MEDKKNTTEATEEKQFDSLDEAMEDKKNTAEATEEKQFDSLDEALEKMAADERPAILAQDGFGTRAPGGMGTGIAEAGLFAIQFDGGGAFDTDSMILLNRSAVESLKKSIEAYLDDNWKEMTAAQAGTETIQ